MTYLAAIFSCLILVTPLLSSPQDWNRMFHEGNIAHAEGDHAKALTIYEEILLESESPNLHYNKGATHQAIGETGKAIHHYLRSWILDPSQTDTLRKIEGIYALQGKPAPHFPGWLLQKIPFSYNLWVILTSLAAWLVILALVSSVRRKSIQTFEIAFLFLGIALLIPSLRALHEYNQRFQIGVLKSEDTLLRVAPTLNSPGERSLQAGEWLQILSSEGDYYAVEFPDKTVGYLQHKEVLTMPEWNGIKD